MIFNQLNRPEPKVLRLDLISPFVMVPLKFLPYLLNVWAFTAFIQAFLGLSILEGTVFDIGLFSAFSLFVTGQILGSVVKLLVMMDISFIFDGNAREVRYKMARPEKPFREKLAFSEIRAFRLNHVFKQGKRIKWMLEILTQEDRFYPVTAFLKEQKARKIVRELQLLVGVPLEEITSEKAAFRGYKNSFLAQFESSPDTSEP